MSAAHATARQIFTEALAACSVDAAVTRSLRRDGMKLAAGRHTYDLSRFSEAVVISLGKAAATLFDAVAPLLEDVLPMRAVVSTPRPPLRPTSASVTYFAGGHPFPNEDSLRAGQAALELATTAGPHTLVLFLISGGGSSLMEAPAPGVSLDDLAAFNRWLVGSGLDIRAINTLRKRVSTIKGGRLAAAATHAGVRLSLLVSDVPTGALDTLSSGPTLPDASTNADALRLLEAVPAGSLHASIVHALETSAETPKQDDPVFRNTDTLVLLSNESLLETAAASARALGYEPVIDNTCDDWDVRDAAAYLVDRFQDLLRNNPRLCVLSGGEVTVHLPPNPGTGGRNSQFALECARLLHEQSVAATVLSAGSDGIDGLSPAAGAIADETTWLRAKDPQQHLDTFNAYPLFAALGDAIVTGPTGNNLRDLRILLPSTD